jgi:hypothetical protein
MVQQVVSLDHALEKARRSQNLDLVVDRGRAHWRVRIELEQGLDPALLLEEDGRLGLVGRLAREHEQQRAREHDL